MRVLSCQPAGNSFPAQLWKQLICDILRRGRKYRAGEGRPRLRKYLLLHNVPATRFSQGLGEEGVACCWLRYVVTGDGRATSGLPAAGRGMLSAKQKPLCWSVLLPCLTPLLPAVSDSQGCAAGPPRACLNHLPGPLFLVLGLALAKPS